MDSATLMRYLAIAQTLPGILKILVILVLFGAFVGVSYLILQSPPLKPNNVSFQRATTFLVMVEPNAYQVGIVAKVFNSDTSSRLISGATIEPLTFQFSGGNGYIKKFFITEGKSTNEEDVAIKPNDFGEVKLLLPIK